MRHLRDWPNQLGRGGGAGADQPVRCDFDEGTQKEGEALGRSFETTLRERVVAVVAQVVGREVEALGAASRLEEIATLDSLSLVEIASALDDAFCIRVPTEAMAEAHTLDDLMAIVVACLGGPADVASRPG